MKTNKGFVHLLLLFVIAIAILGFVGYVFIKSAKMPVKVDNMVNSEVVPTTTAVSGQGLEEELNSLELSDPSGDFTEVDKDLKTL